MSSEIDDEAFKRAPTYSVDFASGTPTAGCLPLQASFLRVAVVSHETLYRAQFEHIGFRPSQRIFFLKQRSQAYGRIS